MKNLPDLGGMFRQMKARDKLHEVSTESILGFGIHNALRNKRPNRVIFKTIMEAYNDNPNGTLDVVDQSTIDLIKELYKP